jgi:hypothetical protein
MIIFLILYIKTFFLISLISMLLCRVPRYIWSFVWVYLYQGARQGWNFFISFLPEEGNLTESFEVFV